MESYKLEIGFNEFTFGPIFDTKTLGQLPGKRCPKN